jgi:hypothetical protein
MGENDGNDVLRLQSFNQAGCIYIFVIGPVGFVIQFLTRKWTTDLTSNGSLQNAENGLVF